MNLTDILSVLGGVVLGAAVAYINMRISKANMNASNMAVLNSKMTAIITHIE